MDVPLVLRRYGFGQLVSCDGSQGQRQLGFGDCRPSPQYFALSGLYQKGTMTETIFSWLQPASSTPGLLEYREVSTGTTGADTVCFQCNDRFCQVRTSVPYGRWFCNI